MAGNAGSSGKRKTSQTLSILAMDKLERLGCEPLQELYEALVFAKKMTLAGGNVNDKGQSDQAQFLALWIKSAETMSKFKYPILSAVAIQGTDGDGKKLLTTREAIDVIKNDPFAPKELKEIPTSKVLDAMEETGKMLPKLPAGFRDD